VAWRSLCGVRIACVMLFGFAVGCAAARHPIALKLNTISQACVERLEVADWFDSIEISPDDRRFALTGLRDEICIWNMDGTFDRELRWKPGLYFKGWIDADRLSANRLWEGYVVDTRTGWALPRKQARLHRAGPNRWIAIEEAHGRVSLLDDDFEPIVTTGFPEQRGDRPVRYRTLKNHAVILAEYDGAVATWNFDSPRPEPQLFFIDAAKVVDIYLGAPNRVVADVVRAEVPIRHRIEVRALDGRFIREFTDDSFVYESEMGVMLGSAKTDCAAVGAGRLLVAARNVVLGWNLTDGKLLWRLKIDSPEKLGRDLLVNEAAACDLTTDGRTLVVATNAEILWLDAASGTIRRRVAVGQSLKQR